MVGVKIRGQRKVTVRKVRGQRSAREVSQEPVGSQQSRFLQRFSDSRHRRTGSPENLEISHEELRKNKLSNKRQMRGSSHIKAPDMRGSSHIKAPDMRGSSHIKAPDMRGSYHIKAPDMRGSSHIEAPDMRLHPH
ncbi:hypothetical protein EYF80_057442 [Liparis tanakae]|uniref:Uncharacterized protein n=1 Tax=Liparis tanakae TaxID=230148 RepID=A0A4Z2EU00_9TELE|nr:hypothetical protein EYF80_057442 [Liparis tanakae]